MQYREFGKTGVKVSALGFGCMRFPEYEENGKWFVDQEKVDEMIAYAYENGVNYFDTAPFYCNKNSEKALGHAVKGFRDKVNLSTKLPTELIKKTGDLHRVLEGSLKNLDTDYVDFYHFWGINKGAFDDIILKYDLLKEITQCVEEGMIRHKSFSFHDDPLVIKYIIETAKTSGYPLESMLVQYNLLDRSNEEMLAYAHANGLGTVAMGPVGGGRLAAPTNLYAKLTGNKSVATYELAFKFVLGNPNLNVALSGMQNLDMVKANVAIASNEETLSESEWKQIGDSLEELKKFSELYCTGCKYCQPCPAGIEIPRLFEMYTHYNVYDLKDHAKESFAKYVKDGGKTSSDCMNCGFCERKCPQKLQIREQLLKVESILR